MYKDSRTYAHRKFRGWYIIVTFANNVSFAHTRIFCNFHKIYVLGGTFIPLPPPKPILPLPSNTFTDTISQSPQIPYVILTVSDRMTSFWVFTQTAPFTCNTFLFLSTLTWISPEASLAMWGTFWYKFLNTDHVFCVHTKYHMKHYGNIIDSNVQKINKLKIKCKTMSNFWIITHNITKHRNLVIYLIVMNTTIEWKISWTEDRYSMFLNGKTLQKGCQFLTN